ncbi:UNKNOWN [Stylonychia lemnae]|uniref:Uncharacterized protein n=1 Tax=Stylonychia lemnae TaxID=5949 RepID=A0A078A5I9_STYLE|nr:UNKNOWN [Stylonychia lemnae]|eukprot:CDW77500.1 UNKNOWN [Stylonychia lemnae]
MHKNQPLLSNKLSILQNTSWGETYQQQYRQLKKQKEHKEEQYNKAHKQYEELTIMCEQKLLEFTEEHSQNIIQIDNPCDLLVDFGKCILNMLHYRILSWNQFKLVIKRYQILIQELKFYNSDLLDEDIQNQLHEFKKNKNFENLNQETGNLLIWMYLKQSSKELYDQMQDLEFSIIQLNREKGKYYEQIQQSQETSRIKAEQNQLLYEVIRQVEENILKLQQMINKPKSDSPEKLKVDVQQTSRDCDKAINFAKNQIKKIRSENRMNRVEKSAIALNISQLNLSRTLRNQDDSHLLSKNYNDDEADITTYNNMPVIGENRPRNNHGFGFVNHEDDIFEMNDKSNMIIRMNKLDDENDEERKTQRVNDQLIMDLSMSSLNNVQLFINDDKDQYQTKKGKDNTLKKINLNNQVTVEKSENTPMGGTSTNPGETRGKPLKPMMKKRGGGCFGQSKNKNNQQEERMKLNEDQEKKFKKKKSQCCMSQALSIKLLVIPDIPIIGSPNFQVNMIFVRPTYSIPIMKSATYLIRSKLFLIFNLLCFAIFSKQMFS